MRSYIHLEEELRLLLEMAEAGLQAGSLEPAPSEDGDDLIFMLLPAKGRSMPEAWLEVERRPSGRLWVNLCTADGRAEEWCAANIRKEATKDLVYNVWDLCRSQSVSDPSEAALNRAKSAYQDLVLKAR